MIITQNVPICPKCSAGLLNRKQDNEIFYFCLDCMSIFQVIGTGKAENELIVTESRENRKDELNARDNSS